jgi:hypothetical protein
MPRHILTAMAGFSLEFGRKNQGESDNDPPTRYIFILDYSPSRASNVWHCHLGDKEQTNC